MTSAWQDGVRPRNQTGRGFHESRGKANSARRDTFESTFRPAGDGADAAAHGQLTYGDMLG
jgi:hypothetical protein